MSDEVKHFLTVHPSAKYGVCGCGEKFQAKSYPEMFKNWEAHLETLTLFQTVRELVQTEHAARAASEEQIRRLLTLGVGSRRISEAIGTGENDRPLVSPTLIQRLGRDHHEQTPRRRRRSPAK
jgi:hypothetical protein